MASSSQLSLTQRESDVLARVERGLENKAIAYELGMAEQTVKEYVSVLLRKFGVANRTALAEAASRMQLTGDLGVDHTWLPQFFRGAAPQICVLRGPDLRYEAANDSFRRAVGDRPVIGRTMRETFPELTGQGIFEKVERVYATGELEIEHESERSWDRGRGIERRQVDLVLQPLRDEAGAVNGVISFAVDVTDLTGPRPAIELRDELATVLDLVPSGVIVADEAGRIVTKNAVAERIWGSSLDPLGPDMPLARALQGEAVVDEIQRLPAAASGEEIRVRVSARPLRAPNGGIRGAIVVVTEV